MYFHLRTGCYFETAVGIYQTTECNFQEVHNINSHSHKNFTFLSDCFKYKDTDKSLARPGRKQATATEDFEFRISYL